MSGIYSDLNFRCTSEQRIGKLYFTTGMDFVCSSMNKVIKEQTGSEGSRFMRNKRYEHCAANLFVTGTRLPITLETGFFRFHSPSQCGETAVLKLMLYCFRLFAKKSPVSCLWISHKRTVKTSARNFYRHLFWTLGHETVSLPFIRVCNTKQY